MLPRIVVLAAAASGQVSTYSWDSDKFSFDPGTCSNYAVDEVYARGQRGTAETSGAAAAGARRRRRGEARGPDACDETASRDRRRRPATLIGPGAASTGGRTGAKTSAGRVAAGRPVAPNRPAPRRSGDRRGDRPVYRSRAGAADAARLPGIFFR